MAWTSPTTWTAGQVVGASDLNTHLRDNLNYLLTGFPISTVVRTGSSDYSLTNTSFADVDATNLILTFTPNGTRAFAYCSVIISRATNIDTYLDIIVDSTTRFGGTNGAIWTTALNGNVQLSFLTVFTGLTAGASHTFKLQTKTASAGTYTVKNNGNPITMIGWGN